MAGGAMAEAAQAPMGTLAHRPAPTMLNKDRFYLALDKGLLFVSTGSAWLPVRFDASMIASGVLAPDRLGAGLPTADAVLHPSGWREGAGGGTTYTVNAQTEVDPALDDYAGIADTSDANANKKAAINRTLGLGTLDAGGRLTLSTGNPVYNPLPHVPLSTDTSAESVTFGGPHGWTTGTLVAVGATAGGLTVGTAYWIRALSTTSVAFYTSLANAEADTSRVNLTASITSRVVPAGVWSTTIRYSPYTHNRIFIFDGTRWKAYTFSELSLAVTCTAGYSYDVFVYDNSGTPTLETAEWDNATVTMTIATPCVVTWTSNPLRNGDQVIFSTTGALPTGLTAGTTYFVVNAGADGAGKFRVAAALNGADINTSGSQSGTHTAHSRSTHVNNLTTQDGVYVKSGATTRRYVGCFVGNASNTVIDQGGAHFFPTLRLIWNAENRVKRDFLTCPGYAAAQSSFSTTSGTPVQWNGGTNSSAQFIFGLSYEPISMVQYTMYSQSDTSISVCSVGLDSLIPLIETPVDAAKNGSYANMVSPYLWACGIGYHYVDNLFWRTGGTLSIFACVNGPSGSGPMWNSTPYSSYLTGEIFA